MTYDGERKSVDDCKQRDPWMRLRSGGMGRQTRLHSGGLSGRESGAAGRGASDPMLAASPAYAAWTASFERPITAQDVARVILAPADGPSNDAGREGVQDNGAH